MTTITEIRENGSKRVTYYTEGPSLTRQEFKDECDLGKVIARYASTLEGKDALAKARGFIGGRFDDVSNVPDYRTSLEQINQANETFAGLPAQVRTRFDNDPAIFLDFVDNPQNLDEMIKMGLVKAPTKVEAEVKAK